MEKDEKKGVKSAMAFRRCAKAALILYALKSPNSQNEEMWKKEIEDLKIQLLKERFNNKKIKLCALVELLLQLLLLLLFLTTFFLFFFLLKSP